MKETTFFLLVIGVLLSPVTSAQESFEVIESRFFQMYPKNPSRPSTTPFPPTPGWPTARRASTTSKNSWPGSWSLLETTMATRSSPPSGQGTAFWMINVGLLMMMVLSLLPIGLMQTYQSVSEGYWSARSPEFMQTGVMQFLRWMRVVGDTVFAIGAFAFVWFALGLIFKKPAAPADE